MSITETKKLATTKVLKCHVRIRKFEVVQLKGESRR